jgi:hypothetical protein
MKITPVADGSQSFAIDSIRARQLLPGARSGRLHADRYQPPRVRRQDPGCGLGRSHPQDSPHPRTSRSHGLSGCLDSEDGPGGDRRQSPVCTLVEPATRYFTRTRRTERPSRRSAPTSLEPSSHAGGIATDNSLTKENGGFEDHPKARRLSLGRRKWSFYGTVGLCS